MRKRSECGRAPAPSQRREFNPSDLRTYDQHHTVPSILLDRFLCPTQTTYSTYDQYHTWASIRLPRIDRYIANPLPHLCPCICDFYLWFHPYMSHESVLSVGCTSAVLAPRPLTPPFDEPLAAPLRVVVADGFARGPRMPSAPEMSLEALEASAGGRPGRASSTGFVGCRRRQGDGKQKKSVQKARSKYGGRWRGSE